MEKSNEQLDSHILNLTAYFIKWKYVSEHGSASPVWTDGQELNFIRRQIEREKKEILGFWDYAEFKNVDLALYRQETPQEMPERYMLRAEEIREHAKASLKQYTQDENYHYIVCNYCKIDETERIFMGILGVLNQVQELDHYLAYDMLVKLKQHEDSSKCLASFRSCRKDMEELIAELEDLKPLPKGTTKFSCDVATEKQITLVEWMNRQTDPAKNRT